MKKQLHMRIPFLMAIGKVFGAVDALQSVASCVIVCGLMTSAEPLAFLHYLLSILCRNVPKFSHIILCAKH